MSSTLADFPISSAVTATSTSSRRIGRGSSFGICGQSLTDGQSTYITIKLMGTQLLSFVTVICGVSWAVFSLAVPIPVQTACLLRVIFS